ncbi:MAG: endopeptidase La, partial [Ruminococcaceae bacterium]|nr:endopeptidase La [Oscillospiraceae bacterium]
MSLNINSKPMPVLALRGLVVFPGMLLHFDVGREKSINALNLAMDKDQTIFLVSQKELKTENPNAEDLFRVGCVAKIRQIMRMSDDNIRVLIEGGYRACFSNLQTINNCLVADVLQLDETPIKKSNNNEAFIRNVQELFAKYAKLIPKMPKDIVMSVMEAKNAAYLSDFIASNIQMPLEAKQMCLEELNPAKRLRKVAELLHKECSILSIDAKIQEKVKEQIDDNQREYYLKEQIRAINFELYGDDGPDAEVEAYREKIAKLNVNKESKDQMLSEVNKLSKMPFGSHEATVVRNYLDLILSLPFGVNTKIKTNIEKAEALLNKEHYGLKKVK